MIPLRLQMYNWLSYRGQSDVFDFRTIHIACLTGANGAGKSSFLEAIHWAVWGEARVSPKDLISHGESDMSVEFVFMVNQAYYRINRTFSQAKRTSGTQLSLNQATDESLQSWVVLTQNSVRETQDYIINQVVGMTYSVFENSAYLRQGQADAFTKLSPAERRTVLAEILEIDQYNQYHEYARDQMRTHEKAIATLNGQMQNDQLLVAELDAQTALITQAEHDLLVKQTYLAYADLAVQMAQQQRQIDSETTNLREAESALTNRQAQLDAIDAKQADSAYIEQQYAQLEAAESRYQTLEDLRSTHQTLQRQRLTHVQTLQEITQTTRIQVAEHQQAIKHLQHTLSELPALEQQYAELSAALAATDTLDARVQAAHADYRQLSEQYSNLGHIKAQITQDQQHLEHGHAQIHQLKQALIDQAELEQRIVTAQNAQQRIQEVQSQKLQQLQVQEQARTRCEIVSQQGKDLKSKKQLVTIGQPCPTCQTMMDGEHFQHAEQFYDEEITRLRDEYTQHRQTLVAAQHAIAALDDELATLTDISQTLVQLQSRHSKMLVWQQQLDELVRTMTNLEQSIAAKQAQVQPGIEQRLQDELHTKNEAYQALLQQQLQNATLREQQRNLQHTMTTLQQSRAQIDTHTAELARLAQPSPQELQLNQHVADIDAQLATIDFSESEMHTLREQIQTLKPFRQHFTELQSLHAQRAILVEAMATQSHHVDTLKHTIAQLQQTVQQQRQQAALYEERLVDTSCNLTLPAALMQKTAKADFDNQRELVIQHKTKLQTIHLAQERLAELTVHIQRENTLMNRYDTLRQVFGRNGIQGMIIEQYAVPALEHEANRILSQMSNNQLYLSIQMQRQTKANTVVERLDIVVSDAQGSRQLEAFSGGESFRISFALRIALSKLLAHRAGRRLETLIIDEGFGTQDEQGREHLVDAINSVSDEFKTILVITHIQEVRDLFPVQIAIRHVDNRSTWEILS